VTELRPHWIGRGHCCAPDLRGEQADEDCVMLAELSVPLRPNQPNGWVVDTTRQVTINESRRAYAVHLRMLQEWLLCGRHLASNASGASALDGDVTGAVIANTVARIRGVTACGNSFSERTVRQDVIDAGFRRRRLRDCRRRSRPG
jgi:hypothetical protein